MSNFIPNKVNTFNNREPKQINDDIEIKIKEKNNVYQKCVTNPQDLTAFSQFNNTSEELVQAIIEYRNKYFVYLSNKLVDLTTLIKSCWSILRSFFI